MNFLQKIIKGRNKSSKENVQAHVVVEEKSQEAHDILNEAQGKLMKISKEIDSESKKTTRELERKSKQIKDVAHQIAVATGRLNSGN